jgi:hypothetical protein
MLDRMISTILNIEVVVVAVSAARTWLDAIVC